LPLQALVLTRVRCATSSTRSSVRSYVQPRWKSRRDLWWGGGRAGQAGPVCTRNGWATSSLRCKVWRGCTPRGCGEMGCATSTSAYETVAAVLDPEMPMVTVADLGIVRDVYEDPGTGAVIVTITPTYSGCPAMATIRDDVV